MRILYLFWTQAIFPLFQGFKLSLLVILSLLIFPSFNSSSHSLLWLFLFLFCYFMCKGCLVGFFFLIASQYQIFSNISLGQITDNNGGDKHPLLILKNGVSHGNWAQEDKASNLENQPLQPVENYISLFTSFLFHLHSVRARNSTMSLKGVRREAKESKRINQVLSSCWWLRLELGLSQGKIKKLVIVCVVHVLVLIKLNFIMIKKKWLYNSKAI